MLAIMTLSKKKLVKSRAKKKNKQQKNFLLQNCRTIFENTMRTHGYSLHFNYDGFVKVFIPAKPEVGALSSGNPRTCDFWKKIDSPTKDFGNDSVKKESL